MLKFMIITQGNVIELPRLDNFRNSSQRKPLKEVIFMSRTVRGEGTIHEKIQGKSILGGGTSRNEFEVLAQVGSEVEEIRRSQITQSHSRESEFYFRCTRKLMEGFRGFRNDMISFMFSKDPSSSCAKDGFRVSQWRLCWEA